MTSMASAQAWRAEFGIRRKKRREIPLHKKSCQPARQEAESQTHDTNQANQSNTAVETATPRARPNQQAGSDAGGQQQSPLLAPC